MKTIDSYAPVPGRRTGKTFRSLLEALRLASEGKHVFYQCANYSMVEWTFHHACKMASVFIKPEIPQKHVLKIANGSIEFVTRESVLRGLRCKRDQDPSIIDTD